MELLLDREVGVADVAGIADRISQKKEARSKWAESMAARLDAMDAAEPAAFAGAEAVLAAQESDLGRLEEENKKLGNLAANPLPKSAAGSANGGTASTDGFPPPGGSSEHLIK